MADGENTITLTRDDLMMLKPSAADFAEGIRLARDAEKAEEASRSAQERIVMGAFGAWIRRRWKAVVLVASLGGGTWKAWEWVQAKAEEQVLERQTSDKQATAVEANTAAVDELALTQGTLARSVGDLEKEVEKNSEVNHLLLHIQLLDPKTKRVIKADEKLKAEVKAVTGVEVK